LNTTDEDHNANITIASKIDNTKKGTSSNSSGQYDDDMQNGNETGEVWEICPLADHQALLRATVVEENSTSSATDNTPVRNNALETKTMSSSSTSHRAISTTRVESARGESKRSGNSSSLSAGVELERADLTFYEVSMNHPELGNGGGVQEQEGEALVNDVDDEKLQQYKRLINATSYFQQYDHLPPAPDQPRKRTKRIKRHEKAKHAITVNKEPAGAAADPANDRTMLLRKLYEKPTAPLASFLAEMFHSVQTHEVQPRGYSDPGQEPPPSIDNADKPRRVKRDEKSGHVEPFIWKDIECRTKALRNKLGIVNPRPAT
jgi:hypothetical protein